MVAASDRHSTSPLPGCGCDLGQRASRLITLAPAARARISVSSVEPESSTMSSSTSPPSSGVMVSTTEPTVSSSLSAGRTTEMVRPAFAASSSAMVHDGLPQL